MVARAAQHRTMAAELGIAPVDAMADLHTIPARLRFINRLADEVRCFRSSCVSPACLHAVPGCLLDALPRLCDRRGSVRRGSQSSPQRSRTLWVCGANCCRGWLTTLRSASRTSMCVHMTSWQMEGQNPGSDHQRASREGLGWTSPWGQRRVVPGDGSTSDPRRPNAVPSEAAFQAFGMDARITGNSWAAPRKRLLVCELFFHHNRSCARCGECNVPALQILYDGDDTAVVTHLRALQCVTLFFVRPPFASALEVQEMWAFDQMHWQWGGCGLVCVRKKGFPPASMAPAHEQKLSLPSVAALCAAEGAHSLGMS